ncbi:magnesium/cobalt transporter CorA [Fusobacterium nucleatum]|uniref:magnesium/cobalt transporter CorA n=1 Tax=Fusobacterium nucleatum TaxID=851 RepID=UPI003D07666B
MPNSNRKLGLLPGSIIYTGENPNYNITITVIYYSKSFHKKDVFSTDDKIKIDLNFDGNIWINIDGINDVNLIEDIGKIFDIDALSLEDIANPEQRVKIDDRDSYIHIILKMLQMELLTKDVQYEQLSLIIKDNILITFQETPYDMFETIRNRLETPNTKLASKDVSYLAYILIDTIVDNYLLVLDEVETEIDDIENKVIESADREDLEDILALKQNIAILKKFISPIRELISKLQARSMLNYFHEDMKYYLGDLNDHGIIVFDTVDMLNSRATELIQLYHSMISNTMNEVMKILAIISTIFMPLSFIVGLYGMNFEYMPELKWHYGYFITLGLMAGLVVMMIIYFKKKKWF